ncbi:hypothetical protein D3C86_2243380 [compost metagenome]
MFVLAFKPGCPAGAVNFDQVRAEDQLCLILLDVFHQGGNEGRYAEQHCASEIELDLHVLQNA